MKVDTWIHSAAWDYRADDSKPTKPVPNDDTQLPLANVWFRVSYGTSYIGNAAVAKLQKTYEDQGIGFYTVIVPTPGNWGMQIEQALSALRFSRGIEFDAEPYNIYLGSETGLQAWLDNVLVPLRLNGGSAIEGKDLSLTYDPRPQWLDNWDFEKAVKMSDSLAAMVYTGMYSGQGIWGDPVGAIKAARAQCPEGKTFRPILQAYSIDPQDTIASFKEAVRLDGKPILFRRGVTPVVTWATIADIGVEVQPTPTPTPTPKPTPTPTPAPSPVLDDDHYKVKGGDNATVIAKRFGLTLDQLEQLNPGQPKSGDWGVIYPNEVFKVGPKPTKSKPKRNPKPKHKNESYTVVGGDTAGSIAKRYGLTLYYNKGWKGTFVALNPGQPRSGNWNTIYPGEVFRVRGRAAPSPKPSKKAKPKRTYTVKSGDTLGEIAVKYGVRAGRWPEMSGISPFVRANPGKLQIGTVLTIPW